MGNGLDLKTAREIGDHYRSNFYKMLAHDDFSDHQRLQGILNYANRFQTIITNLKPGDATTFKNDFQYCLDTMKESIAILQGDAALPVTALTETNVLKILKDPAKFQALVYDKFGPIRIHRLVKSGTSLQSIDSHEQTALSDALEALFDTCQCDPHLKVMLDDVTGYLKSQTLPIFMLEFDNGAHDTVSLNAVFPKSGAAVVGVVILSDNVLTALDGQSDILAQHLQNELFELAWHLKWRIGGKKLVEYAKFQAISAVVSTRFKYEVLNNDTLSLAQLKDLWKQAKKFYATDPACPHKGDFDYTGDANLKKLIEAMIQFATKDECTTLKDLNDKWK